MDAALATDEMIDPAVTILDGRLFLLAPRLARFHVYGLGRHGILDRHL
jgi:hypothetical protein